MPRQEGEAALDNFGGVVDWARIDAWIATQDLPGSGPVTAAKLLVGGTQNNVILVERGGAKLVLRRPPARKRPESDATMRREARILAALAGSAVPHPRFYALCEDQSVIGCCFYFMEQLEGFAPSGPLPGSYGSDARWRRAMGEELVKAAAELGSLDPQVIGLGDFGKPDNWHERQVSRWKSQLEGYRTLPGYAGNEPPHVEEVGRWLTDNLPRDRRIGLVHGDLHFGNVMYSLEGPRISGVIDWELSSLGDPMLDLGSILTTWSEVGDPEGKTPTIAPWDGFLTRSELVRLYGDITGRDMSEMPWFFALACFRLSCILEGTHARAIAGLAPTELGDRMRRSSRWLMATAMQITS